jgi:hypothetical protein
MAGFGGLLLGQLLRIGGTLMTLPAYRGSTPIHELGTRLALINLVGTTVILGGTIVLLLAIFADRDKRQEALSCSQLAKEPGGPCPAVHDGPTSSELLAERAAHDASRAVVVRTDVTAALAATASTVVPASKLGGALVRSLQ